MERGPMDAPKVDEYTAVAELVRLVRGGIDSATWLVNNAHNHDTEGWEELVASARADRTVAVLALSVLETRAKAPTVTTSTSTTPTHYARVRAVEKPGRWTLLKAFLKGEYLTSWREPTVTL